jgi:DNA-binding LacI/PurR family transcriptional regulator
VIGMATVPTAAVRPGRVTISQVAAAAGVSVPTVSKVLNGRGEVAAATRDRVETIIQQYGYTRRKPATAAPPTVIDLVFHELESPWAMELIRGVEGPAREHGLSVVLTELQGHRRPDRSWLDAVAARRSAGLILVVSDLSPRQRAQLAARRLPFVVVDPVGEPGTDVPSVGATNWSGGLAATRHLVELGHRRIGMIGGPADILCSRARIDGYRAALDTAGLPIDSELLRHGDFHVESGYDQAAALLSLPRPPTAIFAGSDLQALGVYEAARIHGRTIPRDLSVVGFDDLPIARWTSPPLTTVRQPLGEMAATAARLLLQLSRGEQVATHRFELATSLVVRESTAALTGDG